MSLDDVIERHSIGVSQHVIKHQKGGCAAEAGFAMKMCPCIFGKPANSDHKFVNRAVERTRVVRDGHPHVMRADTFDNIPLCACAVDTHLLRRDRTAVPMFDRLARPDDVLPDQALIACRIVFLELESAIRHCLTKD